MADYAFPAISFVSTVSPEAVVCPADLSGSAQVFSLPKSGLFALSCQLGSTVRPFLTRLSCFFSSLNYLCNHFYNACSSGCGNWSVSLLTRSVSHPFSPFHYLAGIGCWLSRSLFGMVRRSGGGISLLWCWLSGWREVG